MSKSSKEAGIPVEVIPRTPGQPGMTNGKRIAALHRQVVTTQKVVAPNMIPNVRGSQPGGTAPKQGKATASVNSARRFGEKERKKEKSKRIASGSEKKKQNLNAVCRRAATQHNECSQQPRGRFAELNESYDQFNPPHYSSSILLQITDGQTTEAIGSSNQVRTIVPKDFFDISNLPITSLNMLRHILGKGTTRDKPSVRNCYSHIEKVKLESTMPTSTRVESKGSAEIERPRQIVKRAGFLNRLFFNKKDANIQLEKRVNVEAGNEMVKRKGLFARELLVDNDLINDELYAYLMFHKFSTYSSRAECLSHLEKLARKYWIDVKASDPSKMTPLQLHTHLITVQKVVDERISSVLLAEERMDVDRRGGNILGRIITRKSKSSSHPWPLGTLN